MQQHHFIHYITYWCLNWKNLLDLNINSSLGHIMYHFTWWDSTDDTLSSSFKSCSCKYMMRAIMRVSNHMEIATCEFLPWMSRSPIDYGGYNERKLPHGKCNMWVLMMNDTVFNWFGVICDIMWKQPTNKAIPWALHGRIKLF